MKALLIRSAIVTGAITLALSPAAFAVSAANQTAVDNGVAYLLTKQAASGQVGAGASETGWSAVALAAAGKDLSTVNTAGGTSLRAYLAANPPAAAGTSTDWERSIIAITADGQNPYNFGGLDYVAKLRTFVSAGQIGSATAVSDDIFGLIALMAARVDTSDSLVTGELSYIIGQQRADGGFSYTTDTATGSDTNDTASAIMALSAAEHAGISSVSLANSLQKAKDYLLGTKNADGGFPYDPLTPPAWGGPVSDVSSTSWVVMALTTLGLESGTAGTGAQAYIRAAQQADGSFPYQAPGAGDVFDTAPAVTALAGGSYPLNVYDGPLPEANVAPVTSPTPTPSATPTPTPRITPSPTPGGSVLGDSTTPTAATPAGGAGAVLGTSTLPAVGEVSNLLILVIAFAIAIGTGLVMRYRLSRARR